MLVRIGPFTIRRTAESIVIHGPEALLAQCEDALCRILQPSVGLRAVYGLFTHASTRLTSREVADQLDLKIANASNKLKALATAGYLCRSEESDPSGGVVYSYSRVEGGQE